MRIPDMDGSERGSPPRTPGIALARLAVAVILVAGVIACEEVFTPELDDPQDPYNLTVTDIPFEDGNLREAVIGEAQANDWNTAADMLTLEASDRGIEHLGGIEYLVNTRIMDLSDNRIRAGVERLILLDNVEELDLSRNPDIPEERLEEVTGKFGEEAITYEIDHVAPVEYSRNSGVYREDIEVALSTPTDAATIYYEIGPDPEEPDTDSARYETGEEEEPIEIGGDGTFVRIKALATAPGYAPSEITDASYEIDYDAEFDMAAAPTFDPEAGMYNDDIEVELSTLTDDATIYYEKGEDPPEPDTDSSIYQWPLEISGDGTEETIKAMATGEGFEPSEVAEATYELRYEIVGVFTTSGAVTDTETGQGVEEAEVEGSFPGEDELLFETTTDEDGFYEEAFLVSGMTADEVPDDIDILADAVGYSGEEKTVPFEEDMGVAFNLDPQVTFVTVWDTTNSGISNSDQIELPLYGEGSYDFTVNWGDGTESEIDDWLSPERVHTYDSSGVYEVVITGEIEGFNFDQQDNPPGDAEKLIEIREWGPLRWGNSGGYFRGADNLEITATDIPDLSGITDMSHAFRGAESLTSVPNMNDWNVSAVTDMSHMFRDADSFNEHIGEWDVSSVTDMSEMFSGKRPEFNQDIGEWDVSSVTDMSGMFWNTISATHDFNQDIGDWDVSSVIDMSRMFESGAFNRYIGGWDVSSVTDMSRMFRDARDFNQDIGPWDVSSVTDMSRMFEDARDFNRNINPWDVSSVTDMRRMFEDAWDFNQDIGSWEVSSVTDMSRMFEDASDFNQDIGNWDVSSVTTMNDMFSGNALSPENYDSTLEGWANLADDLQTGVDFHAGGSQYTDEGEPHRNTLTDPDGPDWSISDGGKLDE